MKDRTGQATPPTTIGAAPMSSTWLTPRIRRMTGPPNPASGIVGRRMSVSTDGVETEILGLEPATEPGQPGMQPGIASAGGAATSTYATTILSWYRSTSPAATTRWSSSRASTCSTSGAALDAAEDVARDGAVDDCGPPASGTATREIATTSAAASPSRARSGRIAHLADTGVDLWRTSP